MLKTVLLVITVVLCTHAVPVPQFGFPSFGSPIWNPLFVPMPIPRPQDFPNSIMEIGGLSAVSGGRSLVSSYNHAEGSNVQSFGMTSITKNGKTETVLFGDDNGKKFVEKIDS